MKFKYALLASICLSPVSFAQTCVDNQPASQLNGQFIDRLDGTVLDVATNLLWQKCNVGEVYEAETNTCTGTPTSYSSWDLALQSDQVGVDGFRLPNIKELGSIVDYRCAQPAIDLAYFPTTTNAPYWTNTPDTEGLNSSYSALIIDFTEGQEVTANTNGMMLLRLVKKFN
ncbi:Lcl C-terminal domain-containing protein [Vibrio atypicus]|uniref:Lcl C-terminal domain-containing protein n=1 Tax=Vibrio atypicus TaxID=558271 RepID=UPI0037367838